MEAGQARLRAFSVSVRTFRVLAYVTLALLFAIVVSGATVRLTASGLGCENWPRCGDTFLPEKDFHALVEFGNRGVGVIVGLVSLATAIAAWRVDRLPKWVVWAAAALPLTVLLQGVLGIVLLSLVVAATMTTALPLAGASGWTWLLLAGYAAAVWIIAKSHSKQAWSAAQRRREPPAKSELPGALRPLIVRTAIVGAAVLVGGFFLAKTGEAIAAQTGLGTSFVGAVLLAGATSLPEVSTVLAAVRLRRYEMAVSDIFGTNLFNVTIIFAVDLLYDGPPVLAEVGRFAGFGALLAIMLTAVYLAGMIERRDRTVLRMGFDSLTALLLYAGGVAVLYTLR